MVQHTLLTGVEAHPQVRDIEGVLAASRLMGIGVDYGKAYTRRALRAAGVSRDVAQDVVDLLEGATLFAGGLSAARHAGRSMLGLGRGESAAGVLFVDESRTALLVDGLEVNLERQFLKDLKERARAEGYNLTRSNSRVRKINDRLPINAEYAGKTYPLEKLPPELRQKYPQSIPFTGSGHADFTRYAVKKIKITMTGDSNKDIRIVNKMCNYQRTPDGFTGITITMARR